MKKILALLTAPLVLSACSTPGGFESVDDIRAALDGTPYSCASWQVIDGEGYCTIEGHQYTSGVAFPEGESPREWADFKFETVPGMRLAVVGDGWVFGCDGDFSERECYDVAGVLGGEMVTE